MKVAFIVDTSPSMHVRADSGLTYMDMAAAAIEVFVNARMKQENSKRDKYFLLSTSERYPDVMLSSWEHGLDHFLTQLKLLKNIRTMNSLHSALGRAFATLSQFRILSQADILTGGRLISKIDPSMVIVLTDSDKISVSTDVLSTMAIPSIGKLGELFETPFRWDQRLFILVIKPQLGCSTKIYDLYQKLCKTLGGGFTLLSSFQETRALMEVLAVHAEGTVKVNYDLQEDLQGSFLMHVDLGAFRSMLASQNNVQFMTNGELSEVPVFQENWPFPDELVVNSKMEKLPTRRCFPSIAISKEPKLFAIPERFPYDSYKIIDQTFVSTFCHWTGIDTTKIAEYKPYIWPVRLATGSLRQPFGVLRILYAVPNQSSVHYANLLDTLNDQPFSFESFINKKFPGLCLELVVLPYNFEELFAIIRRGKTAVRFNEDMGTYLKTAPLYYHNYVQFVLDSAYKWGIRLADMFKFEDKRLSKAVANELTAIRTQAAQARVNLDAQYVQLKDLHAKNQAGCCKVLRKEVLSATKLSGTGKDRLAVNVGELNPYQILQQGHKGFLEIDGQLRSLEKTGKIEAVPKISFAEIYETQHVNYPISEMGNYMICLERRHKLRDPKLSDLENVRENEAYFGNPYKRLLEKPVVDETALESEVNLHAASPKMVEIEPEQKASNEPVAPEPTENVVPMREQQKTTETDQSVVAGFYSECYGAFSVKEGSGESVPIRVFKDPREIAEGLKYAAFVESLKDLATNIWGMIRNFRTKGDSELLALVQTAVETGKFRQFQQFLKKQGMRTRCTEARGGGL